MNCPAALFFPLPASLDELFITHLAAAPLPLAAPGGFGVGAFEVRQSFAAELHFHDHLRGNRGVVHAGEPQDVLAAHAAPSHEGVNLRVLEHVAHVERPRNVGRWKGKRKARAGGCVGGAVELFFNPRARPAQLDFGGGINLGDLVVQSACSWLCRASVRESKYYSFGGRFRQTPALFGLRGCR